MAINNTKYSTSIYIYDNNNNYYIECKDISLNLLLLVNECLNFDDKSEIDILLSSICGFFPLSDPPNQSTL